MDHANGRETGLKRSRSLRKIAGSPSSHSWANGMDGHCGREIVTRVEDQSLTSLGRRSAAKNRWPCFGSDDVSELLAVNGI
jgi:hypothetical protein